MAFFWIYIKRIYLLQKCICNDQKFHVFYMTFFWRVILMNPSGYI